MALEMKTECLACGTATPQDGVAYICSYECTYCADCLAPDERCKNCGGDLQPRPRRALKDS